jgi:hypothetical protein
MKDQVTPERYGKSRPPRPQTLDGIGPKIRAATTNARTFVVT